LIDSVHAEQFCCTGCRAAWQLINACGLGVFYHMVDAAGDKRPGSLRTRGDRRFEEFDHVESLGRCAKGPNDLAKAQLRITGIHCSACVWLLEKLPTMVRGVVRAHVNWSKSTVTVVWHPEQVQLSSVAETLNRLGYSPSLYRDDRDDDHRALENRRQLIQIGIAAAAAGNNMLIATALYLGMFSHMSADIETLMRIASCVVGLVSFLGPGRVFLRGAVNAVRTWTPHMDLPIALALAIGTTVGFVNTVRGTGEIYFDSLSVLICLLLIGRWIQFRQQTRAADAVALLYKLTPRRARKLVNGKTVEVFADELIPDDLASIRPGDLIPADGTVIEGVSSVDESILTGESRAVQRQFGHSVAAGTMNVDGFLTIRVTAAASETRIHQVMKLVEEAGAKKPAIVLWANRIGGYFVLIVMGLSLITLLIWLQFDPSRATDRVVAVLVVSCPCALAMATPLAISVALGRLARHRILVKSGDVLQSMIDPGMIWLDKTGTLTSGKMRVQSWNGDKHWIPIVAEVERNFDHPIANALVEFANEVNPLLGAHPKDVHDIKLAAGGVVATAGVHRLLIGNRLLLESFGVVVGRDWLTLESRILRKHRSPIWIAIENEIAAVASLGDTIRLDSYALVRKLKRWGWKVGILSGDHNEVVESVARELEIEKFMGGLSPEQKLSFVNSSLQDGATVMVGDGVNDGAALAAATVGIAVDGGAEASLSAAPVYLARSGLTGICDLITVAIATKKALQLNFVVSITYNIFGVGLAMIGVLGPLFAAILMPLSSVTVIALSLNTARRSMDRCNPSYTQGNL
jgi:Cu2+-exporting ATPase